MSEKIHFTRPQYEPQATCQAWPGPRTVTKNIMEVTCRACLKSIAPERTLDELREAAREVLERQLKEESP